MTKLGKVLKIVAIVLMGLTAAFHLLGGIGTGCVAFALDNYESMAALADFQWLYQLFVVLTVLLGVAGIWVTVSLVKGRENAYRNTIIVLVAGVLLSGVHVYASNTLRGKAAPNDMRLYLNLLTLAFFLVLRIPWIWNQISFEKQEDGSGAKPAAGLAMIGAGLATLTVHVWASTTHTWNGINYADVWHNELLAAGIVLVFGGLLLLASLIVRRSRNAFIAFEQAEASTTNQTRS